MQFSFKNTIWIKYALFAWTLFLHIPGFAQSENNEVIVFTEDIREQITELLYQAGAPLDGKISFTNPQQRIILGTYTDIYALNPKINYSKGLQRFVIRLKSDQSSQPILISGNIHIPAMVPVLTENIQRGDAIKEEMIGWIETTDVSATKYFHDAEMMISKIARRPIKAGIPIRKTDVKKAILVERGKIVTMSFKRGVLTLQHRGIAQNNGGLGDIIKIRNPRSDRIIEAIVQSEGHVSIIASQSNNTVGGAIR